MKRTSQRKATLPTIAKTPTGIRGLDEITGGGLPAGRPTLVAGSAGAGKTMLAAEFLTRGATEYGEPGVFMMFEESAAELTANVRSLGFDIDTLVRQKKVALDHVRIERSEIEETGEYDLEGLFIRLAHAVGRVGAKRVVLDTVEALFAGLPNHAVLRAELRRLFRWLKERGLTAVITAERGDTTLTRYGIEEYVADCVIVLDHRVDEQISTRRLRVVKYRGSAHGTNEYPFIIGSRGLSVLPITSLRLEHAAPTERVSTGIADLDEMLGGRGVYRGSSVLVTGSPGTGKSSLGAAFLSAACGRGERALLFTYEESPQQVLRNMRSVGLDLNPWLKAGLLEIHASRPTLQGLEQHLVTMHDSVSAFGPSVVVVDPISNLTLEQQDSMVKPTLMRLIDFLKGRGITALFTSLTPDPRGMSPEDAEVGISSLMDTWLLLRNVESNGERNRTLYLLKSRGMEHSNQVREFVLSGRGIQLVKPYLGAGQVLTGTARLAQEAKEVAESQLRRQEHERTLRQLEGRRETLLAQLALLETELREAEADITSANLRLSLAGEVARRNNEVMERLRAGSPPAPNNPKSRKQASSKGKRGKRGKR